MPGQRIFDDLARSLSIITCILFQWEDWSAYYYSLLEFYKPIIHCMVFYIVVLAGGKKALIETSYMRKTTLQTT